MDVNHEWREELPHSSRVEHLQHFISAILESPTQYLCFCEPYSISPQLSLHMH